MSPPSHPQVPVSTGGGRPLSDGAVAGVTAGVVAFVVIAAVASVQVRRCVRQSNEQARKARIVPLRADSSPHPKGGKVWMAGGGGQRCVCACVRRCSCGVSVHETVF